MSSAHEPSERLPWRLGLFVGAFSLGAVLGLAGCGNSESDCQEACSWWGQYCVDPVESCVEDCLESEESATEAIDRCVDGNGWGTPDTCQSAGCCLRWVYGDYDTRC